MRQIVRFRTVASNIRNGVVEIKILTLSSSLFLSHRVCCSLFLFPIPQPQRLRSVLARYFFFNAPCFQRVATSIVTRSLFSRRIGRAPPATLSLPNPRGSCREFNGLRRLTFGFTQRGDLTTDRRIATSFLPLFLPPSRPSFRLSFSASPFSSPSPFPPPRPLLSSLTLPHFCSFPISR